MANSELDCRWHFAPTVGGQDQGPNEAKSEFFKKEPYESLVREAIQNSLDAVRDQDKPVHVEFRWKRLTATEFPGLFSIKEHFSECIKFWKSLAARERFEPMIQYIDENAVGGMFCLEISDSNTSGMEYRPNDPTSTFYSFVRSAGNSNKGNVSPGGSYGYGKAAYYNVSKISTVLVSSQTPDGKDCFEGISSICTHDFEGTKRSNVGYYDNNSGEPSKGAESIPEQFRRDNPGTSVFIVGVDQNDCYEEILSYVLTHFWLSIMAGKLSVSIKLNHEGQLWEDEYVIEINKNTLEEKIYKSFKDEHDNIRGHANPRPYYEAVKLAGTDNKHLLITKELPILGNVRFYVTKAKHATDRISYMRSPRMLVYNKPNATGYEFYGVFVCDDEKGNELLRYTENPSHSEWDWKNCRNHRRQECKRALSEKQEFIDQALLRIFSSNGAEFLNIAGLDEFLYIPTAYEEIEDYDAQAFTGTPTGKVQEEGTSSTSDILDPEPFAAPEPEDKTSMGHVLVNYRSNAENAELGDLYSGHTTKHVTKVGDGEPMPKLPSQSHQENDERGKVGTYAYPIEVNYRSFAQVEDGKIYHVIIIHSEIEVEDGQVVIFTGGEQDDERIRIIESSIGSILDNTVFGLQLHLGKNTLKIRLADDMKHAIKLEAYENK